MADADDYVEQVMGFAKAFDRRVGNSMLYGPQPLEEITIQGRGQDCPACDGRGHDDGGPGSWWCKRCNGEGVLFHGHDYKFERYLPYPEGHPSKGTAFDHEGRMR